MRFDKVVKWYTDKSKWWTQHDSYKNVNVLLIETKSKGYKVVMTEKEDQNLKDPKVYELIGKLTQGKHLLPESCSFNFDDDMHVLYRERDGGKIVFKATEKQELHKAIKETQKLLSDGKETTGEGWIISKNLKLRK